MWPLLGVWIQFADFKDVTFFWIRMGRSLAGIFTSSSFSVQPLEVSVWQCFNLGLQWNSYVNQRHVRKAALSKQKFNLTEQMWDYFIYIIIFDLYIWLTCVLVKKKQKNKCSKKHVRHLYVTNINNWIQRRISSQLLLNRLGHTLAFKRSLIGSCNMCWDLDERGSQSWGEQVLSSDLSWKKKKKQDVLTGFSCDLRRLFPLLKDHSNIRPVSPLFWLIFTESWDHYFAPYGQNPWHHCLWRRYRTAFSSSALCSGQVCFVGAGRLKQELLWHDFFLLPHPTFRLFCERDKCRAELLFLEAEWKEGTASHYESKQFTQPQCFPFIYVALS